MTGPVMFDAADCWVTSVLTLDEARHSAQFIERGLLTEIDHPSEGICLQTRAAIHFVE